MIPGLPSITAESVALFRAREARRAPAVRILHDDVAECLLPGPLRRLARAPAGGAGGARGLLGRVLDGALDAVAPGIATTMVARHRFLDDALIVALADERAAVEQVVVLGAGLDSRALRLRSQLAGRVVYEVDLPTSQIRKRRALQAAGLDVDAARFVACDFAREGVAEALARAPGFARGRRAFVIWEGVSMYLPREAVRRTLNDVVGLFAPGSLLGMDFWFVVDGREAASHPGRALPHIVRAVGEPFLFTLPPDDTPAFLATSGLDVVDAADVATLATRYVKDGRCPAPGFHVVLARARGGGRDGAERP